MNQQVLTKIHAGEVCSQQQYLELFDFLLLALEQEFNATLSYDLQENTNPFAIQAFAYTKALLGPFELSLLANLVVDGEVANCDVMLYRGEQRISINSRYRIGTHLHYQWLFSTDNSWIFKGSQDDEHGEYDDFEFLT